MTSSAKIDSFSTRPLQKTRYVDSLEHQETFSPSVRRENDCWAPSPSIDSPESCGEAPQLPPASQKISFIEDLVHVYSLMLQTNALTCSMQTEQFLELQQLDSTMSTIFVRKAQESYEAGTRMLDMANTLKKDHDDQAAIIEDLDKVGLWAGIACMLVTGGMTVVEYFGAKAAATAAQTAAESAIVTDVTATATEAGSLQATSGATQAAESAAASGVRQEAAAAARTADGAIEMSGVRAGSGLRSGAVSEMTQVNRVDSAAKALEQNPKSPLWKLGIQHTLGIIGAFLVAAPKGYEGIIRMITSEQLEALADYQRKVGYARSNTDTCEQIVNYWGHSLERSAGAVESAAEFHKDIMESAASIIKSQRYVASALTNSRRA